MVKRLSLTDQNSNDITNVKNQTFASQAGQSYAAGKLIYDSDNDSLTFFNSNSGVGLQIGQEEWVRVTNSSGSTITNGSLVYINGASSGLPTIALAKADSATTAFPAGIVTADITNGSTGFVTNRGLIHNLNTNAFTAGQVLYMSGSTAGAITSTVPSAGLYSLPVATVVTVSATVGIVYVQIGSPILRSPRINTTTSSATPAINVDTTDQFNITALAAAITSMTSGLTGTPTDGQKLIIRIKDNGTARAITWGTSFASSGSATLITTTVVSKTHLLGFIYDAVVSKWICVAADATGY